MTEAGVLTRSRATEESITRLQERVASLDAVPEKLDKLIDTVREHVENIQSSLTTLNLRVTGLEKQPARPSPPRSALLPTPEFPYLGAPSTFRPLLTSPAPDPAVRLLTASSTFAAGSSTEPKGPRRSTRIRFLLNKLAD
ncbi:hypothetical protein Scep_014461 [Stephania cephalantha]|uniref:Uncharacterized protein n=1 Tax=Stephania cephalantha TaxID=152367 RepID=A0AAP0J221_9MAGN